MIKSITTITTITLNFDQYKPAFIIINFKYYEQALYGRQNI
jgi:hypothetical protein